MALQDEITRIKQAKADIKSSIEAKGGTVGDGTIDTYASAIDNLPSGGGSDVKINNAGYLFYYGNRLDQKEEITSLISNECKNFNSMFYNCNSSTFTTPPTFYTGKGADFQNMFKECSYITSVPLYDTSNGTLFSSMFYNCRKLNQVPLFDLTKASSVSNMFYKCSALTEIPLFNMSNTTNFTMFLYNCSGLTQIPKFDTSKSITLEYMFYGCSKITEIPEIDTSNATVCNYIFGNCTNLITIPTLDFGKMKDGNANIVSNCTNLTNLGGFLNLGKNYKTTQSANSSSYTLDLSSCINLTHDSLMNVINGLYDIASLGVKTQKLVLGSTNLAKLTAEELQICTDKGWSVS